MPRYLNCGAILMFLWEIVIFGMMLHWVVAKNIPAVLLRLSWRQERFSQVVIWSIAVVSLAATRCFMLACTYISMSSTYVNVLISGQNYGRSLIYRLNRSGPSIDPCGTPVERLIIGEQWLFTETCWFYYFYYCRNKSITTKKHSHRVCG